MSCLCDQIDSGIPKTCSNNIGGIKKMYIAPKCNVSGFTLSSPGDEISGITMIGGAVFYEYEFNKNICSYTETETNDEANGTTLVKQVVNLVLNRREKTKRDNLLLLNKFRELHIIITDANDINWLLGEENGMVLKTNEGGSGVAKSHRNGYTITFEGEEPSLANTVTDAALAAVI